MSFLSAISKAVFRPSAPAAPATDLIYILPKIKAQFQAQKGSWVTPNCQLIRNGSTFFYGIRRDQQMQAGVEETQKLYAELRSVLLANMGLPSNTRIVQVVGDSASFSQEGTASARDFLKRFLTPESAILYGYTGHAEPDGTRCVNAAVTDHLVDYDLIPQAIGNLVAFHTQKALRNWGCTGPNLNHYVLVYGDDETCRQQGTVFGDDVTSSDFLAHKMVVLDGGAQSFRQMCNALLLGQEIFTCSGLRSRERAFAPDGTPYFDASTFLRQIRDLPERRLDRLDAWYRNYFGPGKCYVANPQKPDFDTKQKLMDEAWHLFLVHRLYEKLPAPLRSRL